MHVTRALRPRALVFYDLAKVLDFELVPDFLAATSLLEPAEIHRTELKPFLAIFGTRMGAREPSSCEELARSSLLSHPLLI